MAHYIHLINRLPTRFLKNKSLYQVLHGEKASIRHLKVFGYLCFANTLTAQRKKFDTRAKRCVFLGYKSRVKGCILLDLNSREVFMSRNV